MAYQQTDRAKLLNYTLLCTQGLSEEIAAGFSTYPDLASNLFSHYARIHKSERAGDMTTPYRHVSLNALQDALGNVRVIHVVRDPRDVCNSWRKTWFGPPSVSEGARLWREHVLKKRAWGRRNPEQYLEIKYEDILDDQEKIICTISKFLHLERTSTEGQEYSEELAAVLAPGGTHDLLGGSVVKSNRDKWKTAMAEADRKVVEYVAGTLMSESGYRREFPELDLKLNAGLFLSASRHRFKAELSWRYQMRRLRPLLPASLFCAQLLGIPLVRLVKRWVKPPSRLRQE